MYLPNYVPVCNLISWNDLCNQYCVDDLSILALNIRSLRGKFLEFISHLNLLKNKFTFIVLTESWLREGDAKFFEIDGYQVFSVHRQDRSGGGILVYCLNSLKATIMPQISGIFDTCESLFIQVVVPGVGKMHVGGIYRPPERPVPQFIGAMDSFLSFIGCAKAVITGDFNIDIDNPNSNNTQDYINLFHQFGYENEIRGATYISASNLDYSSCLDHCWHNFSYKRKSFIIYPSFADHNSISVFFSKAILSSPHKIKFRNFSQANIQFFKSNLSREFANFSPPSNNANSYANYLSNFLIRLCNRYFPIKTKLITEKKIKSPWINSIIVKCIRKKHRWHRLVKLGLITKCSYSKYVKEVRRLLKIAESEYYLNSFKKLGGDVKRNWRLLNKLLGRSSRSPLNSFQIDGLCVSDHSEISNAFNTYFVNHPQNILETIPHSSSSSSLDLVPVVVSNCEVLYPCTVDEAATAISSLKKNGDLNDIPRKFLLISSSHISNYICKLFNMCLTQSTFPEIFKNSRVIPIYKKGERNMICNYRPVSILCNLSKVFENLIYTRLNSYFTCNAFLSDNQFGFRKEKSTELAVCELINRVLPAIRERKYAICVFLDYTACFDTISRTILLSKLHRYGIRGSSFQLLESYFADRQQYVFFGGERSSSLPQSHGVVQGSKTGPLFFDIYSSDFSNLSNDHILYADDTCLVFVGDSLESLTNRTNLELQRILGWCNRNKLIINPSKSEYLIISNRRIDIEPELFVGTNAIRRVHSFKYLGVRIDSTLKFSDQFHYVSVKLSQLCGISYRLRKYLNFGAAKNLYYSCAYSIFAYCIVAWGGASQCTGRAERISRAQARIVKNLFGGLLGSTGQCLFKSAKILKFPDVYKLKVSLYMYKILNYDQYPSLSNALDLSYPSHGYNTRNLDALTLPFPRVEVVRENFQYQFANVWNDIPQYIRQQRTARAFKRSFTRYLLDQYE